MFAPSTSTTSLLLGSGWLPRFQFQSLRAPTKPPASTHLRSCAGAKPHLLAPISASALPLRVTAAPSPVVEAEDDAGRAAAVRRVAVAVAVVCTWCASGGVVPPGVGCGAAAAGAGEGAGASGAVEVAVGIGGMALRGSWPRVLQILQLLREQGLILVALLGLSAFFSMAETSITTLWPWKLPRPSMAPPPLATQFRLGSAPPVLCVVNAADNAMWWERSWTLGLLDAPDSGCLDVKPGRCVHGCVMGIACK